MTDTSRALVPDSRHMHHSTGSVLPIDYRWRAPGARYTASVVASADELEQLHVYLPEVDRFTNH